MLAPTLDPETSLETLTVAEISHLCQQETARYLDHQSSDDSYGLELFRRAIVQRDDAAWAAIHGLYTDLVHRWLYQWPDLADELTYATFERFWHAMDVAKFARFGSLAAVLQYLKMCALSARMDRARADRSGASEVPFDDTLCALPAPDDVEEYLAGCSDVGSFWSRVHSCVSDEREWTVLRLSYLIGLSPRDICRRHSDQFHEASEVYRIKRNALDRLRRSRTTLLDALAS